MKQKDIKTCGYCFIDKDIKGHVYHNIELKLANKEKVRLTMLRSSQNDNMFYVFADKQNSLFFKTELKDMPLTTFI